MKGMLALQTIVAGLIVLARALYAAWRLMTPRVRLHLVQRLTAIAPAAGGRWLARLQRADAAGATGCANCSAGTAKRHHP